MTYKLTATVTHKTFDRPVIHEFYYSGNQLDDILEQIDTPAHHLANLKRHGRTAFKDTRGVKHAWSLKKIEEQPLI